MYDSNEKFLRELSNKYTANEHTEFFEAKNEF